MKNSKSIGKSKQKLKPLAKYSSAMRHYEDSPKYQGHSRNGGIGNTGEKLLPKLNFSQRRMTNKLASTFLVTE